MKKLTIHLVLSLIINLLLVGCQNREEGISNINIGNESEQKGYIGQPLSIQADIISDVTLEQVELMISSNIDQDWDFSEIFKENISGKKEAKFSTDVDIPQSLKSGKYSLTLKAVKSDGAIDEKTEMFRLIIDSSLPVVSDLDIGLNAKKNDLHLETELTAAKKIKQVMITIQGEAWNKEVILNEAKVDGKLSLHLHEHVHVDEAPEGTYEVIVTVEDQEGRKANNQATFTK